MTTAASKPSPLRRLLFRLPLLLDGRAGRTAQHLLTRAIGIDWIAVETRGRRSGRPHTVVLDVVGHDADTYYVQPAYGRTSDWVRNVAADPHVTVRIDGRSVPARVRDASGREGAEVVLRFIRAHRWYARVIVWFVGYTEDIDRPDDFLRRDLESTPVFAIETNLEGAAPSAPSE